MPSGWKYYNHAMLPTAAPHEAIDTKIIKNGKIWHMHRGGGHPYLPDGRLIGIVKRKRSGGIVWLTVRWI